MSCCRRITGIYHIHSQDMKHTEAGNRLRMGGEVESSCMAHSLLWGLLGHTAGHLFMLENHWHLPGYFPKFCCSFPACKSRTCSLKKKGGREITAPLCSMFSSPKHACSLTMRCVRRKACIIPVCVERVDSTADRKSTCSVDSHSPHNAEVVDSPWDGTSGREFTFHHTV